MNKFVKTAFIAGVSIAVLAGCGPQDVDTGSKNSVEASTANKKAEKPAADEKRFKANISDKFLGVEVNIAEVVIKKDRLEVGLNLKNTNTDQVNWYPDQEGKAVVGDMQLNANMFMGGDVGGEIAAGVKQDGVLVFPTPNNKTLDVKSIKTIKLDLGEITSGDFMKNKKVTFEVPVK